MGVGVGIGAGVAVGAGIGVDVGTAVLVGIGTGVPSDTGDASGVRTASNVGVGSSVGGTVSVASGAAVVAVGVESGVGASDAGVQAHIKAKTSKTTDPLHTMRGQNPALPLSIISSFRQPLACLRVYQILAANPHLPNPPPTPASHLLGRRHSHQVQAPSQNGPGGGNQLEPSLRKREILAEDTALFVEGME